MGNYKWFCFTLGVVLTLALTRPQMMKSRANEKPDDAQQKLEKLRMQLPAILATWTKSNGVPINPEIVKVRLVRRTTQTKAKIILLVDKGEDATLVVFKLRYFNHVWTTTTFNVTWNGLFKGWDKYTDFLMLAIDEACEK